VNVSTAGAGAPVVSTLEDIGAVIVTVLALLVPVLAAIVIVATFVLAIVLIRRWRRRHRAAQGRT
jgi:membrane protein implicated in regulation of membrane protease activity